MDENQEKSASAAAATSAATARNRKMRSWLGVKSSLPLSGHPDDSGPVSYGDGHSGWNR